MTGLESVAPDVGAVDAEHVVRVPRHALTLGVLALLTLAMSFLQTAVTPALPTIQRELHVATTSVAWVLIATSLVAAVTTPIVGRLGDMFGRNRLLIVIVVAGAIGCLVAALAQSLPVLLLGRALQGAGGSIFPLAFAVLRDELPSERRATAYGVIGATWGVGAAAGYPLSGVIVDGLDYHWIFWLGLIAISACGACAALVVPPSRLRTPAPLDWWGGLLFAAGASALLLALRKCLRRVYRVVQGWRPGVAASRLVMSPTMAHLTIASLVAGSRS